jgi:hypothetical protein|tara:strand:- start:1294 stop:1446 length:153 start_codon:yes stop_codon:yes gene_type:complete
MKKVGIIEKARAATQKQQIVKLAKKLEGYKYASRKTIRKFKRIVKAGKHV